MIGPLRNRMKNLIFMMTMTLYTLPMTYVIIRKHFVVFFLSRFPTCPTIVRNLSTWIIILPWFRFKFWHHGFEMPFQYSIIFNTCHIPLYLLSVVAISLHNSWPNYIIWHSTSIFMNKSNINGNTTPPHIFVETLNQSANKSNYGRRQHKRFAGFIFVM